MLQVDALLQAARSLLINGLLNVLFCYLFFVYICLLLSLIFESIKCWKSGKNVF